MSLDVAARLAEGHRAVGHFQTYVSACLAVGYQHPDLTARGSQIEEWFASEEGLDLQALDADCGQLRAAAGAAAAAVELEQSGRNTLESAWIGQSVYSAMDFVDQHHRLAVRVQEQLAAAAESCGALRDRVWRAIEAKVNMTIAIDDRRNGQRGDWLAAAQSVMTGGSDDGARTVVEQQILPFVDADILSDWVTAMRSVTEDIAAAYRDIISELKGFTSTHFEIPRQLIPADAMTIPSMPSSAVPSSAVLSSAEPDPIVPSLVAPRSAGPDLLAPNPVAPSPVATNPIATTPAGATPMAPPVPTLDPSAAIPPLTMPTGSGLGPGIGSGISSLIGQLSDALSGPTDHDLEPTEPSDDDEDDDDENDEDEVTSDKAKEPAPEPDSEDEGNPADGVEPPEQPSPPTPVAVSEEQSEGQVASITPPAPEAASAEPEAVEDRTACEIAADELPQVGQ